jgi:hypothetical protein
VPAHPAGKRRAASSNPSQVFHQVLIFMRYFLGTDQIISTPEPVFELSKLRRIISFRVVNFEQGANRALSSYSIFIIINLLM